jgi:hypothetical protein
VKEDFVKIVCGLEGLGYKEISYGDHNCPALISIIDMWQFPALLVEVNNSRMSRVFTRI